MQVVQVNIASLRVPETPGTLPEEMRASAAVLASACGYLVLYLDLFASILGAPLLHEGGFMGLHSAVWQPATFWKRSVERSQRLLLSAGAPEGLSMPFITGAPGLATWGPSVTGPEHEQCRRDLYLQTALRLLMRSSACACQHYMAQHHRSLPLHWSSLAWLVLVSEFIQGSSVLSGLSAWDLAAGAPTTGPAGQPLALHPCFHDLENGDEDWSMVQTPGEVLPPPPSEEKDTEHWERAMILDRQQVDRSSARVLTDAVSSWMPFKSS